MTKFVVDGFFPEIVAHKAYQSCEVEAGNFETAARRALVIFRKRDGVKGRRIRHIRLTLNMLEKGEGVGSANCRPLRDDVRI